MRLKVRDAVAGDVGRLREIAAANPTAPQWTEGQFTETLRPGEGAMVRSVLVAEANGDIAGYAVLSALPIVFPVEAELESIAVAPEWQRRGVGRRLMAAGLAWAESVAATTVRLEVRTGNEAARALYEGQGFREDGVRRRYYANPVEDAICMVRNILESGS